MNNVSDIFGKQLRSLDTNDFEKRTFNLRRYIKNGI
tara:strand:+ start:442 stop:549 length:108 start_codon:yes stop_codon:yes gene_type:complete